MIGAFPRGRGPEVPSGGSAWFTMASGVLQSDAPGTVAFPDPPQQDATALHRRRRAQSSRACFLTATAIVASMGSPTAFKDAREFAAWIGLVPRQTGTGGRVRQLGISKRGDAYLRTLLMHGARAVVRSDGATKWPWLSELLKRRPYSVAVAALGHKLARTIWAVLAKGQACDGPDRSGPGRGHSDRTQELRARCSDGNLVGE